MVQCTRCALDGKFSYACDNTVSQNRSNWDRDYKPTEDELRVCPDCRSQGLWGERRRPL